MKKLFTCSFPFTASLLVSLMSLLLYSGSVQAQTFAKGADVGWLQQMEATGYVFYNDNGVTQDCFQILKDKGINSVRFRVFVNPSADKVSGHCSKDEVVAMSVRAKAMGFRIMIDFHYSDTWADPGKQVKPAAWANHTFSQLKTDVYDHTYDVMNALKTAGVTPEWVQVGNEIRGGMLRPDGSTSNYPQLAQLITSGYNAVKAVSPTSKVIVHLDRGNDSALYRNFFDNLRTNGAMYDVIGMSYYPYWLNQDYTVSINALSNNLRDMVTRYGKEVIVAEVGGDYTAVQNTYDMLVAVQNAVKSVSNSKGLGVFYWEPQGAKSWSGYQLNAWGDDGKPTRALDAFLITSVPTSPPTLLINPGFEANQFRTQTPTGWSTWSKTTAMAAAQYTETDGHLGNYRLTHYSASPHEVSLYQVKTGLPSGTYTLKAWVKSGGGQTACQLYAKNFGGTEKKYPLPVGNAWTQIQIADIQGTNGQCEIGLYTVGNAGNYCSIDDIEFYANQTGARLSTQGTDASLRVCILGNPVQGGQAEIEIRGAENQPIQLLLTTEAGATVLNRRVNRASSTEYYSVPLSEAMGIYLLRVSSSSESVIVKVVRQ